MTLVCETSNARAFESRIFEEMYEIVEAKIQVSFPACPERAFEANMVWSFSELDRGIVQLTLLLILEILSSLQQSIDSRKER